MSFRCLFHVHTRHSFDSFLSPATIIARARKMQVDVLIVTDHETIAGALDARASADRNPRFVIVAAEYNTDKGDIIGLFLREEIRTRRSDEVIERIRAQGGLVVLPHPYKGHRLDDGLLAGVEFVESYKGRCSPQENDAAAELAARLKRPILGGPDAHCAAELDGVLNHFEVDMPEGEDGLRHALIAAPRRIETRPVPRTCVPYSQMIKGVKTRNPLLFLSHAKRLAAMIGRESFGQMEAKTK